MKSEKPKQKSKPDVRQRDLAKIHIGKKQLGLDDITYREMLFDVAGVDSAADLNSNERELVLEHLKKRGFKPRHKSARNSGMMVAPSEDRAPLISKIGAILADLGLPWRYADAMALRMYKVNMVRWLKPDQLKGVLAALIYHQNRTTKKRGNLCTRT